ncbi:UMP kinase [Vulcanisaeta thermophila]|uniref:UMP kinase n=1 Tax=Vulcanisaeta thermophila TaxID=867917 RepID=UPI0008528D3B|nr:UMP kinase [Vulcanisaeta thermophila]
MLKGPFVLKMSGHVFDNEELLLNHARIIRDLWVEGYRMVVVTGGGSLARHYIGVARRAGVNESLLDTIGIAVSRLNALLLASILSDISYLVIPGNLEDTFKAWSTGRLVIIGGFQPGQSTATVALLTAEYLGFKYVVDCANIDAVYTSDPRIDPSARRIERISAGELMDMLRSRTIAGTYDLLDPWALSIARRGGITIYVISCSSPNNLVNFVRGGSGVGTIITP